jgi:hypothetical protein
VARQTFNEDEVTMDETMGDLPTLAETVNAARQETNRALGQLTPRNARRAHDPLHDEREATNRLLMVLMRRIDELEEVVIEAEQRTAACERLVAVHEMRVDHPTRH